MAAKIQNRLIAADLMAVSHLEVSPLNLSTMVSKTSCARASPGKTTSKRATPARKAKATGKARLVGRATGDIVLLVQADECRAVRISSRSRDRAAFLSGRKRRCRSRPETT